MPTSVMTLSEASRPLPDRTPAGPHHRPFQAFKFLLVPAGQTSLSLVQYGAGKTLTAFLICFEIPFTRHFVHAPVTEELLSGDRKLVYGHDSMGNVTSLTPPGSNMPTMPSRATSPMP